MRWLTCLCVALVLCISVGAAADRQLEQAAFQDSHPLVAFYQQGERITRVYGPAFGHGATPEAVAEQFRTNHAGIFGVDAGDLVPVGALADGQHTRPLMLDPETGEYKFTLVYFTQQHDGVPIFRSELRLLVRNLPDYPLVWVGSSLHDLGDFRRTTNVANDQAGVQAALDFSPGLMNFSAPEAVIWAGVNDQVVEPALAATFTADNYDNPSAAKPEKWLFVTDAQTGEILYKENMIIFEDVVGHADGNATQGIGAEHCELEAPEALKWARVGIGTTYAHADANGDFVIPNSGTADVTVESWLRGLWFRVYNAAGADAALSQVVTPPGPAYFLHNEANTEFYRAQVNGYVEANVIRDMVISHYPDYPGLQQSEFPVNVNLTGGYCPGNAWYDYSSINFCLAASGYPNTAWGAVIHHEYGHHLVSMGGSGQDQYGEGMADSVDVVINDDPGLGYGFYGDCNTPLRNADNNYQYPCTGGAHDCAQLLSGCIWSTRNELIITEPADYLQILQSLTVNSIPMHTGSVITPQITIDFLTLDDDDANIDNGTPHYFEIDTGFGAHNMPAPPLNLLTFTYPNGRPDFVAPGGGTTMRVEVGSLSADPEPGTGLLHYSTGSGYTSIPMTEVSDNIYDAAFPAFTCGTTVNYYVSAETTSAQTATDPIDAPASAYATLSAYGLSVAFEDNFETDKGWTVVNENLTDGPWGRGVPVGGGDRGDPPTDYDGSGACYLTDNVDDNSDVDGGPTRLISPTFELLEGVDYRINYARWFYNDDHDIDRLDVHIHNGTSWVLVESVPHVDGWVYRTIDVSDYVTPPATIQMRFSATDNPNDSVTEAGIDAFSLVAVECEPPYEIGDLNCDGNIDGFDIDPFVLVMMSEPPYDDYYAAYPDCNHVLADINQDGDINGFDIDAFVALLQG